MYSARIVLTFPFLSFCVMGAFVFTITTCTSCWSISTACIFLVAGCSRIPKCSQCEETFADICDRCEDGFLLLQQGSGAEVQCVASCPAGFVKHGTRCRAGQKFSSIVAFQ